MDDSSNSKILLKNTMMLYIMTAAKFVLPVIVSACLTRRLGPDNYGIVTYVATTMNYFILLFDFGFNYSVTKKISLQKENPEYVQKCINNVFSAKILLSAIGLLVIFAMILSIGILRENIILTVFYYIFTVSNIFLPDFFYRGIEKMEYITVRYVVARVISTLLIFILIQDVNQMIYVPVLYTLGNIIAVIYTLSHMKRNYSYSLGFSKFNDVFNELRDSFVYFLSTFATTALSAFNTFIMGVVNMPAADIAYWGVAFQVVQAVQSLYEPIVTSIYPRISKTKNYKLAINIAKYLTPLVVIGCIALYYLSGFTIKVLAGNGYEGAIPVLRLLIPVLLFSFWAQVLGFPLLGALGKQKQVTQSTIISAFVHLLAISILIFMNRLNLFNLSIVRDISEFILFGIRLLFVLLLVRTLSHEKEINLEE